jgi:RNA polymerase sigma factor (sigma-70 family)
MFAALLPDNAQQLDSFTRTIKALYSLQVGAAVPLAAPAFLFGFAAPACVFHAARQRPLTNWHAVCLSLHVNNTRGTKVNMTAQLADPISDDMALVVNSVTHVSAHASQRAANPTNAPESLSVSAVIGRYHDSLLRFLRKRLRVADDAADVAQEAYIRMMQYEGSKEVQSASSLLFRIAINVAHDLGRAEQSRRMSDHYPIDDLELASEQPTPEREVAAAQDLEILYLAIEQLPPKCQQVFLLSRAQRMTYPQIAVHCGISVKMVEKHISHALEFCARKVGGRHTVTS